jgi:hypothetical protein
MYQSGNGIPPSMLSTKHEDGIGSVKGFEF